MSQRLKTFCFSLALFAANLWVVRKLLTAEFINQSLRCDKFRALGEYWAYRRMFMSGWGVLVLIRGLLLLVLPDFLRKWLRR